MRVLTIQKTFRFLQRLEKNRVPSSIRKDYLGQLLTLVQRKAGQQFW